ncbi:hypothetical protein BVRB_5g110650 isoform C [Beta vulgaris subsp. vulgaris]|nr:hypothetical protein BVRB_5g110650 isoform C [Beta vulgaris subsp. vulgaris]
MSRFCLIHRSSTPPSSSFKIYPWRWCDHFLRPPHWISFIALYLRVIDHCCRPRVAVAPPRTPATFSSNFQLAGFKLEVVKTTCAGHAKKLASTVDFSTS